MPSESIPELLVNDAATNFEAAIRRLLAIAATIALGVLLTWPTKCQAVGRTLCAGAVSSSVGLWSGRRDLNSGLPAPKPAGCLLEVLPFQS
jgi:hypothetical protein